MQRTKDGNYYYPDTAYRGCKWCRGRGCLMCPKEEEDARFRAAQPIFTARLDSPEEMEQARRVIGMEALEKAFGPDGGGVQEIELNAAVTMFLRAVRRSEHNNEPAAAEEPAA